VDDLGDVRRGSGNQSKGNESVRVRKSAVGTRRKYRADKICLASISVDRYSARAGLDLEKKLGTSLFRWEREKERGQSRAFEMSWDIDEGEHGARRPLAGEGRRTAGPRLLQRQRGGSCKTG